MRHPPLILSDLAIPGGKAGLKRLAQQRLHARDRLEVIRLADQMDGTGDLTIAVLGIFADTDRTLARAVEAGVVRPAEGKCLRVH